MTTIRRLEASAAILGTCPRCRVAISPDCLLIRYEPTDGWPTLIAGCPVCGATVHPT